VTCSGCGIEDPIGRKSRGEFGNARIAPVETVSPG
jgi:hypothetical protein